jgi:poly(ADP-ribose) glycohydrolase ARH3
MMDKMPTPSLDPDKIRGALLGTVVGDAFGSVLEGIVPDEAPRRARLRADSRQQWRYTDDGAMTLAVAESLAARGGMNGPDLLRQLAARYDPVRGFGKGMRIAIDAFFAGRPWQECAFAAWPEGSRGNGAAVRVAPVSIVRWPSAEVFREAVRISAIVTHAHPEAADAALAQAQAISIVLAEPDLARVPTAFLDRLTTQLPRLDPAVSTALATIRRLLQSGADAVTAARALGTSTFARESVPAALWSFLACKGGFQEAVAGACLLGGDVDSICALVGSLAGALHGAESIPGQWIANLSRETPDTAAIASLADRLHELEPPAKQD